MRKGQELQRFKVKPTPRIVLFFYSVLVLLAASLLSAIGFVLTSAPFLVTGTVVWILWFFLLFLIAIPSIDHRLRGQLRWMKRGALVVFILLLAVGISEAVIVLTTSSGLVSTDTWSQESEEVLSGLKDGFAYNDATALTHQAIDNLLEGKNPYAHPNVIKAITAFSGTYNKITPLRVGRFVEVFPYPEIAVLQELWNSAQKQPEQLVPELESKLNYPAGSFLLPAPLVALGIKDLRIIYAIFIAAALAYVTWRVPGRWRLLFLGAFLVCIEITNGIASGETGSLTFPLLLLAWVLLPKQLWVSAIFMGLAAASKQTTWFLVPFYLINVFVREERWKIIPVVGIMISIFLALNLPFFVGDPKLWLRSIWAPMIDPMFPIGVGIITVVTGGLMDIQSSLIFTALELSVLIAAIVWYFINCRRYPNTGPILAILPLFFAWRSLWPYFYYANIIVLAGVLVNEYGRDRLDSSSTLLLDAV
jgi:hypothetical protein